jgi:hypothetical protein
MDGRTDGRMGGWIDEFTDREMKIDKMTDRNRER